MIRWSVSRQVVRGGIQVPWVEIVFLSEAIQETHSKGDGDLRTDPAKVEGIVVKIILTRKKLPGEMSVGDHGEGVVDGVELGIVDELNEPGLVIEPSRETAAPECVQVAIPL